VGAGKERLWGVGRGSKYIIKPTKQCLENGKKRRKVKGI
jgi:hypothetical protein